MVITKEVDLNGRKLKLETGKLALQADASVVVSWGETVLLVTVAQKKMLEAKDFLPLTVEYVEKYYAGGKISSSKFIKRENKPSDEAILTGRLIDRSIRPLFPKGLGREVQVIITVLSIDQLNDPDLVGLIGTSAALSISSLPWHGPLGGARIGGTKDGKFVANPLIADMEHLDLDLMVASTKERIVMIEAKANQVEDGVVFEGIKLAHQETQKIIELIDEFTKEAGKEKLEIVPVTEDVDEAVLEEAKKVVKEKIEAALFDPETTWHEATGDLIKEELVVTYAEKLTPVQISSIFDKVAKVIMHDTVLNEGKRVDGRAMDEVRPIEIEVGLLPRTHGSAVFKRGDTQVLSVVTLGATSLSQTIEGMTGEEQKRFMHHYNMSINPFATGEVKRIGSPNRRDLGHGALVEKSLGSVIPPEDQFPYAIRVVSEVLAANASTSKASVCATTLALLNAGVPIEPVAGIAMGLISEGDKFQVITDMRAVEDFYGEMDFKVSGTKSGITAIQMDTKLEGLTFPIVEESLRQGKNARLLILDKIHQVVPEAGPLSPHAPRVQITHIKPEEIGALIGPGGKNINSIIAKTGAHIDVEDDGTVMISSSSEESMQKAVAAVEGMFKTVEVGEEFMGKVVRLAPFGAFVEITPGKDGLVHISQMAPGRVERPEDVVSEGQEVKVRVTGVNNGKISLSMLFGADIKPETEGPPRSFRGASFAGETGRPQRRESRGEGRFDRGSRGFAGRGGQPREGRGDFRNKSYYFRKKR